MMVGAARTADSGNSEGQGDGNLEPEITGDAKGKAWYLECASKLTTFET